MTAVSTPSDERRRRYLDAARRLFAEHGFVGTTTDMIVAEVGGSKATLYRHFPTKDALVAGIMDEVAASMNRGDSGRLRTEQPLAEALFDFGRAVLRGVVGAEAIGALRLCLGEYGRFPELARVVWDHGPAVTYANFHAFLAERERRGEVRVPDTQFAAEQFVAGIVGHIQLKVAMGVSAPPDDDEVDARVASAVETFLARYATAR